MVGWQLEAIEEAIKKKHQECLSYLLNNVLLTPDNMYNALLIATKNDDVECFKLLLNVIPSSYTTLLLLRSFPECPINIILKKERSQILHYIIQNTEVEVLNGAISKAYMRQNVTFLKFLISNGMNMNSINPCLYFWGTTMFHKACIGKKTKVMKLLLGEGFDINTRDVHGYTPFCKTAAVGNVYILRFLMEHNCDIDTPNNMRHTPLMCAAKNQRIVPVKMILKHKSRISLRSLSGAVRLAAGKKHNMHIVKLLLSFGAGVDTKIKIRPKENQCKFLIRTAGERAEADKDMSEEPQQMLANLCRIAIRKILIKNCCPKNLFIHVPKLPLPQLIKDYLLYYQTLSPN
jgi:ankyrin repeat protein